MNRFNNLNDFIIFIWCQNSNNIMLGKSAVSYLPIDTVFTVCSLLLLIFFINYKKIIFPNRSSTVTCQRWEVITYSSVSASVCVFCSSRSPSTSRVSRARTSIRRRAACGTAGRRTRRRSETRTWRTNSRAWWDASTSLGPVSPARPRTPPTATVRQHDMWRRGETQLTWPHCREISCTYSWPLKDDP